MCEWGSLKAVWFGLQSECRSKRGRSGKKDRNPLGE